MRRIVIAFACLFAAAGSQVFAGGQKESGREAAFDSVESGQFINPAQIDALSYLDEFPTEVTADPQKDLTISVELEKPLVLARGDRFNLQITLATNADTFYPMRGVNYIVYFHNPGLLLYPDVTRTIVSALSDIRSSMGVSGLLCLYSAGDRKLMPVGAIKDIAPALDALAHQKKQYQNDAVLGGAFEAIATIDNDNPARFVWVTDDDLLKNANDTRVFTFSMKLYAQNRTSFAYVGYGEKPAWATMNASLLDVGGSSYYVEEQAGIAETLRDDYRAFARPTVEDVRITLAIYPWISALQNDYREEWYPAAKALRPTASFYDRPATAHYVKSMDYGEHKTFLHYLGIDAQNLLLARNFYFFNENGLRDTIPVGLLSVEYWSHTARERRLVTKELTVTYTRNWSEYEARISPVVQRSTVLQNTPYILKELSVLVSQTRDYHTAILLVDNQIGRLRAVARAAGDQMVSEEIENLVKYKDLLLKQARSLNYIR